MRFRPNSGVVASPFQTVGDGVGGCVSGSVVTVPYRSRVAEVLEHTTSMNDVFAEAGLSAGVVYSYFTRLQLLQVLVGMNADAGPQPSAWSRCCAAMISDRWVNACGKLPSCSPSGPISSA